MPTPRLNARAISASLDAAEALELGEDPGHRDPRTVDVRGEMGRQDACEVGGDTAAGHVGRGVDRSGMRGERTAHVRAEEHATARAARRGRCDRHRPTRDRSARAHASSNSTWRASA